MCSRHFPDGPLKKALPSRDRQGGPLIGSLDHLPNTYVSFKHYLLSRGYCGERTGGLKEPGELSFEAFLLDKETAARLLRNLPFKKVGFC